MRLIILFLLLSLGAMAQEPPYTPMRSNYRFRGVRVDSLFMTPSFTDTTAANAVGLNTIPGNMIRVDSIIYVRTGTKWVKQGGGSAVNINTGFGLTGGPITGTGTIAADTSALATPYDLTAKLNLTDTAAMLSNYAKTNTVNTKVDSINKSSDSVYYYKNGIKYFAFKDSSGSGSSKNGRWGNDTALVIFAKVHNATGTQLLRGEIVYLSGANGDVASVKRANNKYDSTSATTIGMVKDNIASGDTGWVVTQGQISKINTSAFNSGDIIYLDSINGKFTKSKQYAPYHLVFIGVVERANAGNGQIYLKPQNGYELNEIHDVQINSAANNQVLVYSDTQKLWKNRSAYSVIDTTQLSSRIDQRVKYSDTASMLTNYALKNYVNLDQVTTNGNTTLNQIRVGQVGYWDQDLTGYGLTDLANGEFRIYDKDDNFIASIGRSRFNLFGGGGTAQIDASNMNNERLMYLPDVDGTFAMRGDSTLFQTKYRTDSMRTNIYSTLNVRVKYTDTAGMLTNYAKTNLVNTKVNISDTASMLTNYAKTNVVNTKLGDDPVRLAYQAMGSTIKGQSLTVYQPRDISSTTNPASGSVYYIAYYIPYATTITGVKWWQGAASTFNAGSYNGFGLYSTSGGTLTLVASSTNDTTVFKSNANTWKSKAFSSTYSAAAGLYYIAICHTTTGASGTNGAIGTGAASIGFSGFTSVDLTNSYRYTGSLSGTSLPSTQAASGLGNLSTNYAIWLY